MDWQAGLSLAVVVGCFTLLMTTWLSADLVMSAGLTVLILAGVLEIPEALAGFASPAMLTVAVLYVVVSGLTETGSVRWIVSGLLGRPTTLVRAQARLMLPVAGFSAFLNNTPVVAIFIPAVTDWARRYRLSLSRLLIPLSYASIAGGVCTLIGTSTNLVVDGLLRQHDPALGLALFDLVWIGLPVVAVVLLFVLLAGRWLLPERQQLTSEPERLREYTAEMVVPAGSPLIGHSIEQAGLRALPGLFLAEIERGRRILPAVSPHELLQSEDRLVFVGAIDSVVDLQKTRGLVPATDQVFKLEGPRQNRQFVEAVVSHTCPLIGRSIRAGRFRTRYSAAVLAVARHGARLDGKIGDIVLRAGDTLLLEARTAFVEQQRNSSDFYLVSQFGDSSPPNHERAPVALAITTLMVLLAGTGLTSMLEAALLAAGAMIGFGCTSSRVARRSPDWQVLVVIATSFGIGVALHKTGAADLVADSLLALAGDSPWLTLVAVFALTALLSSMATNNVAAVLVFPIAVAAAGDMQVSLVPYAVTIMVAASASFATPIGYQTNLMVFSAGGYRFGDFLRIGLPLTLLVGLVTVALVPLIWPFQPGSMP